MRESGGSLLNASPARGKARPGSWTKRVLAWLATAAACYVVFATVLVVTQERAIFPGAYWMSADRYGPPGTPNSREVWREAPDGEQLAAYYHCPPTDSPLPAVVVFHGNGEFIEYHWGTLAPYRSAGYIVLAPEYRGYGRMGGEPSEGALERDMEGWVDWLREQPEVDPERIIYHGTSLGGGVACTLIDTHPPAALLLQHTFKSVASFSARYGLPAFLCRHPFLTIDRLREFDGPVFIQHGTNDGVIPFSHGKALHEACPQSEFHEHDGNHNHETLWEKAFDFLARAGVGPPHGNAW